MCGGGGDLHITQSRQAVVLSAHWPDSDNQKQKNPEIQSKLATRRTRMKLGPKVLRRWEKAGK